MFYNYNPIIINQISGYWYYDNQGIINNQSNLITRISSNWFALDALPISSNINYFNSAATAKFNSSTIWKWYLTLNIAG
jgi:hypothetical protein